MTGLVLEGGAIRTIYSSGVCDGLLHEGVMADYVVGVSAGIAYGVSYVSRQEGRNLKILERYVKDERYMGTGNVLSRRNHHSYFGLDFIYDDIPNFLVPFDYETYNSFPGLVEAGVTNLLTGKTDYYAVDCTDRRLILLRATCAMPLLFPIYKINGKPYLDGGVGDSVPFRRALDRGCDKLIVVLTRERSYYRQPEKLEGLICRHYAKYPAFCETVRTRAQRYNQDRAELLRLEKEGKALIFCPKSTKGFSRTERDMDKIRAAWQAGRDEAVERIDAVRSFVG